MRQLLTISSFHLFTVTYILLDGLSIPFFNLGQNVSRTVSLTTTLTFPRSRVQPDWVLNINHIAATLQETRSEMSNVHELEVASPTAGTNTPTNILRQEPHDIIVLDIESGPK